MIITQTQYTEGMLEVIKYLSENREVVGWVDLTWLKFQCHLVELSDLEKLVGAGLAKTNQEDGIRWYALA